MSSLKEKLAAQGAVEGPSSAADAADSQKLRHELRLGIALESYRGLRDQAVESGKLRSNLAFWTLTSVGLVFTMSHYWKTGSGVGYDVLADFAPAAGLLVCIVMLSIGRSRYREECTFTRSAIRVELENDVADGAAMTRARMLQFDKLYVPSRGALSALCCGLCVIVFGIVQFWS